MKHRRSTQKPLPKHLSVWQDKMKNEQFLKYCKPIPGDFKYETVNTIRQKGYRTILDAAAGDCSLYHLFKEVDYEIDYTAIDITEKYVNAGMDNGINIFKQNILCNTCNQIFYWL